MNWISVKERLPFRDDKVLVYKNNYIGYQAGIYIAWYMKDPWNDSYYFMIDNFDTGNLNKRPVKEFTHWMPLPKGPE